LKWIGSKQKFAHEIIAHFPARFGTYFEPFIGAGGVLATLQPRHAVASDAFGPLIEIWQALRHDPEKLKQWYAKRRARWIDAAPVVGYEQVKASYNRNPNGADLLFLCRACYGGVVRFRKSDGYMSTPVGAHTPISPASFDQRVDEWHPRVRGTDFQLMDFADAMAQAKAGDLVYCDPPYSFSQSILYGAQDFSLQRLLSAIADCKRRGVFVALSIDGTKKSGDFYCDLPLPKGLFEREVFVNLGRSMLRRFQLGGQSLESEVVRDRLLLTY
jgi:DNA adenine methylase